MKGLFVEIFKATVRSQSRAYWIQYLLLIAVQIAAFVLILRTHGFWYAVAAQTVLNFVSTLFIKKNFDWGSYVTAQMFPSELYRKELLKSIEKKYRKRS